MESLREKIRSILSVELQIDRTRITPEVTLRGDLGMDSIAALNILYAMEEVFGIGAVGVTEISSVLTVADVENLVCNRVPGAGLR